MRFLPILLAAALASGCQAGSEPPDVPSSGGAPSSAEVASTGAADSFKVTVLGEYDRPWAAAFLPGTDYLAITQQGGQLLVREQRSGRNVTVSGVPRVLDEGQGGLGDVVPAPGFDGRRQRTLYLSWVEAGPEDTAGAVLGSADLDIAGETAKLTGLRVIWRQPKVTGRGHYSHRIAFARDGGLFLTSGERQKFDPALDPGSQLGKILLFPRTGNGANQVSSTPQIFSLGHRNGLGLAFDADGRLWESEMGPRGGDEVNLITRGGNYGWPQASNGSHYNGRDIPDHRPGDGFVAPKVSWNPSVSPSSLMIYSGAAFPQWRGDGFIGALSGQALIRVDLTGDQARKAQQWPMGARIREVEQGPDGAIYLLEDGSGGRLLRLDPVA